MSESLKSNDRAKFIGDESQAEWLLRVLQKTTVTELASLCGCSERTVRDWRREKFSMTYEAVCNICSNHELVMPLVERVSRSVSARGAGVLGGKALIEKYGKIPVDELQRKTAHRKWWNTQGKDREGLVTTAFAITVPKKSIQLAEFVGIMIGDGTVAPYHIAVTLNAVHDREYADYVAGLIFQLFKVVPKVYFRKDCQALNVVLSRKRASAYMQRIGLPLGDKMRNNIRMPNWVVQNEVYMKAALRGLVDTDGSLYRHNYSVGSKTYSYPKITFTSGSATLRSQFASCLERLHIAFHESKNNVHISRQSSVQRYLKVVGTSNKKFLKRLSN